MQTWKIIVLGVTGDLAKRKVLPSIGQFAEIETDINTEVIGYSRSVPNREEIELSLNSSRKVKINSDSISFYQGEYNDPKFYLEQFSNLKSDERMVLYFAVPPIVFADVLEIICPFNVENLDVIMEKPFGNNLEEAERLIRKIKQCKLEKNVHFFDHYNFKGGANLQNIKKNLTEVELNKFGKRYLEITISETLDVAGREGYYDQVGALKDMFPSHCFTLLKLSDEVFDLNLDFDSINIDELKLGQYKGYSIENSNTETSFNIVASTGNIEVTFVSGKKLSEKKTSIKYIEDSNNIELIIDPDKKMIINGKESLLEKNNLLDHTSMLARLKNREFSKFLSESDVICGWKLFDKVNELRSSKQIELDIY